MIHVHVDGVDLVLTAFALTVVAVTAFALTVVAVYPTALRVIQRRS